MENYLNIMRQIMEQGVKKETRTRTGSLSLFGMQMRFNLEHGFPIVTTKRVHFKSIVTELLWFLKGDTRIHWLNENGCTIWDEWADESGNLGPIYGKQWRDWHTGSGSVDQISEIIQNIKTNPISRRHVISAWNPADLPDEEQSPQENVKAGKMALAPCHMMMQFYVAADRLSCLFYARSQDYFLGTPFNIASYALLTILIAEQTGLKPGDLIWTGGDVHLYQNHLEQAKTQLTRTPHPLPKLKIIQARNSIFDYTPGDFQLENYLHHPPINAPIAI